MPSKKVRVITANDPPPKPKHPIVVTASNPRPNGLTEKEIQARVQRKYATVTTMGALSRMKMGGGGDVLDTSISNFYSPQLSTDFLEKPQNLRERRAFYRFFYNTNEYVGAAIDKHSTIPLSKLRLVPPKCKNRHLGEYAFKYFQNMCDDMKLFKSLIEITFEYYLMGNVFCFSEEHDPYETLSEEELAAKKESDKARSEYLYKKFEITDLKPSFKGWKKLIVLPPDQVRVKKIPLSDEIAMEFVPDPDTRRVLTSEATQVDLHTGKEVSYDIPTHLKERLMQSGAIPLDVDPNTGSFCFHLSRKKSQYESLGVSIIERCVNTLVLMDKLRQAQTSIASRHMTPMRIVWADQLADDQVDSLREQVDLALIDPDFSIIANYEIHWDEMGVGNRLLDLTAENEENIQRLLAGLEMTKEVLTGEGSYSGTRISLEVMNTMYLLYRETIQDYVENCLFKPVARKKGFIEYDEYGNEILIYPKLSFTRLSIRDNETFFDACFQLYQKGSISIDLILDLLNIDPEGTKEKIENDLFTVNDNQFNELLRNMYMNLATKMVDGTDVMAKVTKYLKLTETTPATPPPGAARFSSEKKEEGKDEVKKPSETELRLAKLVKHLRDHPEKLERIFASKEAPK